MTTKAEQAEAERKVMARLEARLAKAERDAYYATKRGRVTNGSSDWITITCEAKANEYLRILRASASALFPGRQQRKHVLPALGKMVTASCRVIRRGAS